jgi:hypothetical protein
MSGTDLLMAEVDAKSMIIDDINSIINDNTVWIKYHEFDAKPVSEQVLTEDPFLSWLADKYEFIGGILKINPFSQYDWHTDTNRGVSINMLVAHKNSFVMFSGEEDSLVKKILPMQYKLNRYYLFNPQIPHSVINFEGDRYMFTIEFKRDKNSLTYEELYNDVFKNYYTKKYILNGEENAA